MTAIAGIAAPGCEDQVARMLAAMAHRGSEKREIFTIHGVTLGAAWRKAQPLPIAPTRDAVRDAASSRCAEAMVRDRKLILRRDPLGIAPLYIGRLANGALAFASEVKGLRIVSQEVREFPPGGEGNGEEIKSTTFAPGAPLKAENSETIASGLRQRLAAAVEEACATGANAAWLSGGVDSSAIAALAKAHVKPLRTFAGGLRDAPDLQYARAMAEHIGSEHHEIIVSKEDLLAALPEVIYYLESFDSLLVRSSIVNYLVAKQAAQYSAMVLSGEGGDELFAGYEYLRQIPVSDLTAELLDLCRSLHNTALQRVDRCAAAHGMLAHVPFLDLSVVEYAWRIPVEFKLREGVEKWILRKAVADLLPASVRERRKSKFWEGSGVGEILAEHAERSVSDADFARERNLANGWVLNSKEELLYYRIFRERLGEFDDLCWMGRSRIHHSGRDNGRSHSMR